MEQTFTSLADAYGHGLLVFRSSGHVAIANRAAHSMLGRARLADGDSITDLLLEDSILRLGYEKLEAAPGQILAEICREPRVVTFRPAQSSGGGGAALVLSGQVVASPESEGIMGESFYTKGFSFGSGGGILYALIITTPTQHQLNQAFAKCTLRAAEKANKSVNPDLARVVVYDPESQVIVNAQGGAEALFGPNTSLMGKQLLSLSSSKSADLFKDHRLKVHKSREYFDIPDAWTENGRLFPMRAWVGSSFKTTKGDERKIVVLENVENRAWVTYMSSVLMKMYKAAVVPSILTGYAKLTSSGVFVDTSDPLGRMLTRSGTIPPNSSIRSVVDIPATGAITGGAYTARETEAAVHLSIFDLTAYSGDEEPFLEMHAYPLPKIDESEVNSMIRDYKHLCDALDEIRLLVKPDMKISFAGGNLWLLGYSKMEELVDQDVTVLMSSEHREKHASYVERYRRTGERRFLGRDLENTFPCVTKQGQEVNMLITAGVTMVKGMEVFYASMRLPTVVSKEARLQLQVAQDLFHGLVHSTPTAQLIVSPEGIVVDCNKYFSLLISGNENFGENFLNKQLESVFPDLPSQLKAANGELCEEGEETYRCNGQRFDGIRFLCQLDVFLLRHQKRSSTGYHKLISVKNLERENEVREEYEESINKLSALIHSIEDAIFVAKNTGEIEECNASAEKLFGYTRDELVGDNVEKLLPPKFREKHQELITKYKLFRKRTSMGTPQTSQILTKHGAEVTVDVSLMDMVVGDESIFVVLVRDVTERMDFMRSMKQREEHLESNISSAASPVICTDEQGTIRIINPAARDLFGYTTNETLGKNISMLMRGEHEQKHTSYIERYLMTGEARVLNTVREFVAYKKDDSPVIVEIRVSESIVSNQHIFTALLNDVTERKRNEAAIAKSEQEMKVLVEYAFDGIIVADDQGIITSFNPSAQTIFEQTHAEAMGQNVSILMPAPYCEEHQEYIASYLRTGRKSILGKQAVMLRGKSKSGRTFNVEMSLSEIYVGSSLMFTAIVRDVTSVVQEEEALTETRILCKTQIMIVEEAIIVVDRLGRIVEANGSMKNFLQYHEEANEPIEGSIISSFLLMEDMKRCMDAFQMFMDEVTKSGSSRVLSERMNRSKLFGQWHRVAVRTLKGTRARALMHINVCQKDTIDQLEIVAVFKPELALPDVWPESPSKKAPQEMTELSPPMPAGLPKSRDSFGLSPNLDSVGSASGMLESKGFIAMRPEKKQSRRKGVTRGKEMEVSSPESPSKPVKLSTSLRLASTASLQGGPRALLQSRIGGRKSIPLDQMSAFSGDIRDMSDFDPSSNSSPGGKNKDTDSSSGIDIHEPVGLEKYVDKMNTSLPSARTLLSKHVVSAKDISASLDKFAGKSSWGMGDSLSKLELLTDEYAKVIKGLWELADTFKERSVTGVDAVKEIMWYILESLRWEIAHIYEWDPMKQHLRTSNIYITTDDRKYRLFLNKTKAASFVPMKGMPGTVFATKEPMCIVNLGLNPASVIPRAPIAKEVGVKGCIGLPLPSGPPQDGERNMIGILEFFSPIEHTADKDLLDMLELVVDLVGQTYHDKSRALLSGTDTSLP